MATGQGPDYSSGESIMYRLVRSLSGKGLTAPNQSVLQAEERTAVSSEGNNPGDSAALGRDRTTSGPSAVSEDNFSFAGVLDKFKNLGLGLGTSVPTPDHPFVPDLNISANNDEPFPVEESMTPADPAEPTYLASKIQSLLNALPLPTHNTPKPPRHPKPPKRDAKGRPIPPSDATPISDPRLIAMLQSATVMNGGKNDAEGRHRRVSVWSVLESLGDSTRDGGNGDEDAGDDEGGDGGDGGGGDEEVGEASGIMMYSPLMPTNLSLVEIAESGIVLPEEPQEPQVDPTSEVAQVAGWMGMWPFSILGHGAGVATETGQGNVSSIASPTPSLPSSLPGSPNSRNARLRVQSKKRVWIPSTTKLSFQAVWWGYRMYLPPPVMDILNDNTVEAAKRAAMLTTALTWFFSNIPLMSLPPALRPALLLLQTLIPYIGYIGSFISWSWGTIQSYDKGCGVILTATWLLPVALIPSTWDAREFPPPSPPPQPDQPLPPTDQPTPSPPSSPTAPLPTPPASPPSAPSPQPTIPVQLPMGLQSPALSFVTAPTSPLQSPSPYLPLLLPTATSNPAHSPRYETPAMSPIQLASPYPSPPALPHASEPLPPWVPPPPPPNPPTIPLPELDEPEVKFGLRMLRKKKTRGEGGERRQNDEREEVVRGKEGKGKARLRAIVGALGAGKGEGSKNAGGR
ncbi:hypothetical protein DXG01_014951 [Tephrocybe rancida]|nr:hypothetical protein DXG01_014951 [Tephrocybe rancida]